MQHKEKLTNDRIMHDILKKNNPWPLVIVTLFVIAVEAVFLWFYRSLSIHTSSQPTAFEIILFGFFMTGTIALIVYDIVQIVSYTRIARALDFHVLTDTLIAAESDIDSLENMDIYEHGPTYYFYFASFGKVLLCRGRYYTWSKLYAMDEKGMMIYASRGDTYYIVTKDDKTVLMMYNTKLFDYQN